MSNVKSHKLNVQRKSYGFTLIEMLVYLALFALIMTGAFAGAYQLIEHSGRTREQVVQYEEMQFLMRRLEWALGTASEVTNPEDGEEGSVLMVSGAYGTARFELEDDVLLLDGEPLSSNRVDVTEFSVRNDEGITIVLSIGDVTATSTTFLYE